jgi:hypothetical protein
MEAIAQIRAYKRRIEKLIEDKYPEAARVGPFGAAVCPLGRHFPAQPCRS